MVQKSRAIAYLVLAVLSAVAAVLLTRSLINESARSAASPPPPVTEPVVVVSEAVQAGSALGTDQLDVVQWPRDFLPRGAFSAPEQVVGRVLQRSLEEREPLLESALAPQGAEAGLGSLIEDELRAMAVKVDPVIIVAGFVRPGSRVDVIATMRTEQGAMPYSGVILQDLKVLAIDQKLEQGEGAAPELGSVVTLEVAPGEAQKLAYAANEGSLQLVLRNPVSQEKTKLPGITGKDVMPEPEPAGPGSRGRPRIEAIRGAQLEQQALPASRALPAGE